MANLDQKTILIDNAYAEIKKICINLQKDNGAFWKSMINRDQKTILIDNAYGEIKNICINLQKIQMFRI